MVAHGRNDLWGDNTTNEMQGSPATPCLFVCLAAEGGRITPQGSVGNLWFNNTNANFGHYGAVQGSMIMVPNTVTVSNAVGRQYQVTGNGTLTHKNTPMPGTVAGVIESGGQVVA